MLVVGADDKVTHRNVTADGTQGLDWVVTSGLTAGDRVIVSGIQTVQIGAPARTEPWQPPAPAAQAAHMAPTAAPHASGS
ncbi:efflux RND transporter periplasmic adaptor subunit [Castellaniella caeni]